MKELIPRERFIRTLRHEPVDRVSVLYRMKHEAKEKIARVFGVEKLAPAWVMTLRLSCA